MLPGTPYRCRGRAGVAVPCPNGGDVLTGSPMLPPVIRPVRPKCPRLASASVDFPQPNSPTSPPASPSSMTRETPVTAGTGGRGCNRHRNVRHLEQGACAGLIPASPARAARPRTGSVPAPATTHGDAREQHHVREHRARTCDSLSHAAPSPDWQQQTEAEEAKRANGDHDIAETQTGIDDERAHGIRQYLDEHNSPCGFATQLCGCDERAVPQGECPGLSQSVA